MFSHRFFALLVPALLVTLTVGATQASAGSLDHSPRWRKASKPATLVVPPQQNTPPTLNPQPIVEELVEEEPANETPVNNGNNGNDRPTPTIPKAVPTPSAFGAGLLLMGGALIRRRRQA